MRKIPIGSSGLALSFFILTQGYNTAHMKNVAQMLFYLGTLIFIITVVQWILDIQNVWKTLCLPEQGAIIPTIGMGIIVYSSEKYHYFNGTYMFCYTLFWIGLGLFVALSILFFYFQLRSFSTQNIFPSWYIPTVGILVVAIAGYNFRLHILAIWVTALGVALFLGVTQLLLMRFFYEIFEFDKIKKSFAICAAPASLIVFSSSRYMILHEIMLIFLVISLIVVICVYMTLPKILERPFEPSHVNVTFPIAISAVAIQQANIQIQQLTFKIPLLSVVGIEISMATLLLFYILIRYIRWIFYKK